MTEQTETLPPETPPAEPQAPRVRRTLGLPVVAAVAVATLLIGGLAGGIIGYAVHSDGPDRQGPPGQRFQQGGPSNGNGAPQPPSGQQDQQGQQQDDSGTDG